MALKDKIRALRGGDTQTAFGARFGVEQSTVGRWERGAVPGPDALAALARYAGVTYEDFISRSAPTEPQRPADVSPPTEPNPLELSYWAARAVGQRLGVDDPEREAKVQRAVYKALTGKDP